MRCVICALAKNEHRYINDWVKHYVELGFSTIYLYDNDSVDSDLILDFIDNNLKDKIHYINIRGRTEHCLQHHVYQEFYKQFNKTFDWCLFCDIDEYLVGIDNINTFLNNNKFDMYNSIRVKWNLFGDDDVIERDLSISPLLFFKNIITDNKKLSNQGKFFIRGNLNNIKLESCHYAKDTGGKPLSACLPSGKRCLDGIYITTDYSEETVFLNHYMTKTLSEFIQQKLNRGDAVWETRDINLDYFWKVNKKTDDKLRWLTSKGIDYKRQYKESNYMAIGGYCLSLYVLGSNRIKGPLDNILLYSYKVVKYLFDKSLIKYLKTHKYVKVKKKHPKKNEPPENFFFKTKLEIIHNDFENPTFINTLEQRCNTFCDFYKKLMVDSSKNFIFAIPYTFVNNDGEIDNRLSKLINYLSDIDILDRVIFVGSKKAGYCSENVWWNVSLPDNLFRELYQKYKIKYIELTDIDLSSAEGKNNCFLQFKDKIEREDYKSI